jgi:hypothetical protein
MELPDVAQVQVSSAGGRNSSDGLDEVGAFASSVHNYHNRVVSSRFGELDDEVDTSCVPAAFRNREGLEFSGWEAAGYFGAEAEVAGRDVLADVSGHVRPPVVPGYELQSFEPAGVACDLGVMAKGDYTAAEIGGRWHVDSPAKVQESVAV